MSRWRGVVPDLICVTVIVIVWGAFFWRLLTPVADQQVSLARGDFSAQFVTFGAYQYERLSDGEVPLWNPYNNGGLPFIADTQAAVFYPPRLLTVALAGISEGFAYHALELEMVAHVLLYVLMFYGFMRRLTLGRAGSPAASLTAALTAGFGGYMTGYPPLQLALLEAAVWLPAVMLAITEATRGRVRWRWFAAAGWFLGLSWMAGHPQTSFFLTYLSVAYLVFRAWPLRARVSVAVLGVGMLGVICVGVVAVTLLPGIEYLLLTSRAGFDYAAKSSGFPIRDLLQILVPQVVSQWSPLWIGTCGLMLAAVAILRPTRETWFWSGAGLVALVFSLGANGPLYPLLYNIVPGLSFFRGQERAAFVVANAAAVLVGFGALRIAAMDGRSRVLFVRCGAGIAAAVAIAGLVLGAWPDASQYGTAALNRFVPLALLLIVGVVTSTLFVTRRISPVLVSLIVLELLLVAYSSTNYEARPSSTQINANPLIEPVRQNIRPEERVDGLRVLGGNWGSYYGIADIHGISPLFLAGPQDIIDQGLPDERAWELFAVRYVYSDWTALPVPSEVLTAGADSYGPVNLHQLTAPRPFAHFVYDYVVVDTDEDARLLLADPQFNPRVTAVLHRQPDSNLPMEPREHYATTVTRFEPESITIQAETPENAILTLALVDYPGWQASVDGLPVPLVRAYGGLTALELEAGRHTIDLRFSPLSFRVGGIISALTWTILIAGALTTLFRRVRRKS